MINTSNIKNTLTNIAGILGAISGVIIAMSTQGVPLPAWLLTAGGVCAALSIGILGYFSRKNPDGSVKTQTHVVELNTKAAATKDVPVTADAIVAIKNNIATVTPPATQPAKV